VGPDALIDALWGDSPPTSARKTLQTYVSNIRRELGPEVISTAASGYSLGVAVDDVDLGRFRGLVLAAEEARARGAEPEAREQLRAAVALWRGDPFPGAGPGTGLAAEAVRLREEYLTALEARLAADLAAGCHAELVGELETLVREHPFRERLWGHLMVALYRSGRQADALAAYQRARARAAATFLRALAAIDIRPALPTITAPTLVLHATRDQNVPVAAARHCCELIPGATLVELDSDIHLIWLSDVVDEITRAIEAFIARTAPVTVVDRVLATVLATAGPARTAPGDALVRTIVERWGGHPVGRPGCAAFDGPARAIRCARALVSELGAQGLTVGAAVHSGECEPEGDGLRGVAVDVARELAAGAGRGDVLVTQTVGDLVVGSPIELESRGRRAFSGVPGDWEVFAVTSAGG
jgi:DNA-binding SARP family transcriptional activator